MPDDLPPKRKRLSLSRTQLNTNLGAELLSICQTVTEDGRISEEEAIALAEWLASNEAADLPAIAFLRETVTQILADGKVTAEEQRALFLAVEKVLPPEIREGAKQSRQSLEAAAKTERKATQARSRADAAAYRERNRRIGGANFMVAGVLHEGRASLVEHYARIGDKVFLVRDRTNAYSRNAIEVRLNDGWMVGYVPEIYAGGLAPTFDTNCLYIAYLTKILDGRRAPIPVVQVDLYRSDALVDGTISEADAPMRRSAADSPALAQSSNRTGFGCAILALVSSMLLLILLKGCL